MLITPPQSILSIVPLTSRHCYAIMVFARLPLWGTTYLQNTSMYGNPPYFLFTVSLVVKKLLGISPSLVGALLKGLQVLLVLHPVSAGLSCLTFIQALFLGNHGVSVCALIIAILTAIISSVTLAADLALVIVAKSKVKDLTIAKFEVEFGNAVWMVRTLSISSDGH